MKMPVTFTPLPSIYACVGFDNFQVGSVAFLDWASWLSSSYRDFLTFPSSLFPHCRHALLLLALSDPPTSSFLKIPRLLHHLPHVVLASAFWPHALWGSQQSNLPSLQTHDSNPSLLPSYTTFALLFLLLSSLFICFLSYIRHCWFESTPRWILVRLQCFMFLLLNYITLPFVLLNP